MNLTWHKFYIHLISEKAIFSILFNYAVIQLFFIVVGRKYAAIFLSQLFVIFLNFINKKKQQYLFSNLSPEDIFFTTRGNEGYSLALATYLFYFDYFLSYHTTHRFT